jgi:hypothetical protein
MAEDLSVFDREVYRKKTAGHWRVIPSKEALGVGDVADLVGGLIYATVWDSKALAEESAELNAAHYGHERLGVYPYSGGWLVVLKLRDPRE